VEKYKIVFCGELQGGHDLLSVKSRLAGLFKVPGVVIDKLFQAYPVLIRTDLPLDVAQAFKLEFEKTGARCQLLEVSAKPKAPAIKPKPKPVSVPEVHQAPVPTSPGVQRSPGTAGSVPAYNTAPAADRQFAFRNPTAVKKKSNSKFIWITVVILLVVIIFFTNLSKDRGTTHLSNVSSRKTTPSSSDSGSNRSTASKPVVKDGLLPKATTLFSDPSNYYTVELPSGCKVLKKSTGRRSKISYIYSKDINVSIIASPMTRTWDPQGEMMKKVTAIQDGRAGPLSRLSVADFGLITFNELNGYELVLSGNNQLAHAYALVSPNNIAFSISIVTTGNNRHENHDILDETIRFTLTYK